MFASLTDKLITAFSQYIWPQHKLTHLMYRATRITWKPWKNWQMRWFVRKYDVNMNEAQQPILEEFSHFNAFFTRELKPQARPVDASMNALISPVDGRVSQIGTIVEDQLYQAKGTSFSLDTLLGGDANRAKPFHGGNFATLYLSPRDYHRIHMPMDGRLTQMVYVPGRLFSVSPRTTRTVPALFARNERVVCLFETAHGPLAVVLVGAMFVASMETVWEGVITPRHKRGIEIWDYTSARTRNIELRKGDELGRFNMGSTVILALAENTVAWPKDLDADSPVKMGQRLGTLTHSTTPKIIHSAFGSRT